MKYLQIVVLVALLTPTLSAETTIPKFDQLKAAAQKICPVSGKPLDSMGDPLKVKIGQEEIFLCCDSCTKGKINPTHWATVHKNFAAAQGKCPVMEKALPANPKFTVVDGQIVYVCCPPCTKKIQADSKKFLTMVAGYYQTSLKNPAAHSAKKHGTDISKALAALSGPDRLRAEVQKICPVSGGPLGSMGIPQKVRVGELEVFLCCEGCKEGEIDKRHWVTIAGNIKKAQSRCPVMEKELPAKAKSMIVDGQLVYVCCPPCTKKIAADPKKYLAKVAEYYKSSLAKAQRVAHLPQTTKR